MNLATGVWELGVWAPTVWAQCVWWEPGCEVTPPVIVVPPEAERPPISGVKRRVARVRRADFSTQAAYELALKMAMADARFAVVPFVEPPRVSPEPRKDKSKPVPVDASLAKDLDREIKVSAADYAKLQQAAEMEEIEMLKLFVMVIEEDL